ncbi:glycoside hydrolase family 18 [Dysgonomonas sp. 511]|uniref:glycoside hydrolase family 18 n=1 Tax=Dysgonomonas sp. 511 TaxID=2302930 RepID=UPI0013D310E6|nr:glycoside hydrolase family 18 [Dysgonomonas sp. 511]NDV78018.1 endoglycosidase [Dysgonomonas sp. 511]
MKTSIINYRRIIGRLVLPLLVAVVIFSSCDDWTETDSIYEPDQIELGAGKDEAYYKKLRMWKATSKDRSISFGWYGGWTGIGTYLVNSLSGLPDSIDLVSIWGDWKTVNDAKRRDLEYVQRVKGTKVTATLFTQRVGQGMTPADVEDEKAYWGWDPSATALGAEPNEEQIAAIRKYANAVVDTVLSRGYDGLDIDFEGSGDLMSGQYRWKVFIEEIGKRLGPKSGTGKLLILDYFTDYMGSAVAKDLAPYFNYFLVQAYAWQVGTTYTVLNSRATTIVSRYAGTGEGQLSAEEVLKRFLVNDSFEHASTLATGGLPFTQEDGTTAPSYSAMAAWQPLVNGKRYAKGGCGVYHIEYGYSASGENGFYPYTRKTIQIMNPAGIE